MAKASLPRPIRLRWPAAGIVKRYGYQDERGLYGCPDALNVWPDSSSVPAAATQSNYARERGGSRPGLGKAFSTQLGSGNPIRTLSTIQFIASNQLNRRLVAISNGTLYMESADGTTLSSVAGTFNSQKQIQAAERNQVLYIADHSDVPATSS